MELTVNNWVAINYSIALLIGVILVIYDRYAEYYNRDLNEKDELKRFDEGEAFTIGVVLVFGSLLGLDLVLIFLGICKLIDIQIKKIASKHSKIKKIESIQKEMGRNLVDGKPELNDSLYNEIIRLNEK